LKNIDIGDRNTSCLQYLKTNDKMKRMKKYLPFLFVILFACKDENKETTNKIVPNLNNLYISGIVTDNSNTMWFATDSGLYKSAEGGYELQNIVSGKVLSLYFEKNSNTLWIGTEDGLYNGLISGNSITGLQIPSSNLSNKTVSAVYIDSTSKRWFGTNQGITLNKGKVWKKEKFYFNELGASPLDFENSSINAIAGTSGNYYFATNQYGLYRAYGYDESVDAFSGASQWGAPYNGDAASDSIFTVIVDSKGMMWFGGNNGVQSHMSSMDSKLFNDAYLDQLPNIRVHAIAEAPDGKIWVGTENGLTVFDGTSWSDLTSKLANTFVTAIAFNKNGSALIGTKKGLYLVQ
jgi:ligand-binding sensor domain-containing protein